MKFRILALAGLAVLALATQPALAGSNDNNQRGWGPGMMMGGAWDGQGMGMMGNWGNQGWRPGMMMQGSGGCGMMGNWNTGSNDQTYVVGRIAFLAAELKITDSQKPAWNEYADALRSNSQLMISMHQRMMAGYQQKNMTSPQWLNLHIQFMKSHLAALEALEPATESLYKVLTADQKQNADRLLPGMGCM